MLPVNLLALDSAHFDTSLKAGQGVQPPETGFSAAFGAMMQAPGMEGTPIATFPPGSGALTSWSAPGGEILPQGGNGLPSSNPVASPEVEAAASDILAYPGTWDGLAESATNAPGDIAPATTVTTQSNLAAPAAGMPGSPGGEQLRAAANAAPAAAPQPGTTPGATVPANAAHSDLVQHFRYLRPVADAPAARPLADTGAADTSRQAAAEARLNARSTIPQATGVQEFAQQITDAARAGTALTPAAAEAFLRGDVQDLKATTPSAAGFAPLTPANAAPAAHAAPSPAAPLQWVGSSIDAAPGQPGWNEALGDRVTWMAGNRIQNAELRLNPAELGPLRVHISMDDGNATVTFSAQHPLTRDAIEQALPRLREMLADQGLSLQNASVNDQGPRHQQAGPGGQNAAPQFVAAHDAEGGRMMDGENLSPVLRAPSGLVDVFA